MSVARGWQGEVIVYANINKELLGYYNASTNASFLTSQYPITKAANESVIDNTSFVTIYIENSSLDNSSFNISGESGFVHIHDNVNISGNAYISYQTYRTIGYASEISLSINNNVESIFVIGQKTAKDLVEGLKEITGTIREFYIDRRVWDRISAVNQSNSLLPFLLKIRPYSNASYLVIKDIKFGTYDLDFSQEAIVEENLDFYSKNISYS